MKRLKTNYGTMNGTTTAAMNELDPNQLDEVSKIKSRQKVRK
jgi:hypothetical protein